MSERIKQMTVQQLIDAGFQVNLYKHNCGDNPSLEAKQWLGTTDIRQHNHCNDEWASNWDADHNYNINPEIVFFR